LTQSLLLWIASYEEDILRYPGLFYRRKALQDWHEPAILPERVPEEWRDLAQAAEGIVTPRMSTTRSRARSV
jgi:hypothetical protein